MISILNLLLGALYVQRCPGLKLSLTNYRVITVDIKKILYIIILNFDNKKRNLVNSDGDSYGFVDDIESRDFIRAEIRLGQNLKTQLFLVYSLLALVPHCICPFFIGCWWLWAGGRCWLWVLVGAGAGYWGRWMKSTRTTTTSGGQRSCSP